MHIEKIKLKDLNGIMPRCIYNIRLKPYATFFKQKDILKVLKWEHLNNNTSFMHYHLYIMSIISIKEKD